MKKIVAVFDGYKMCRPALEYAIQLTKDAEAHLVGAFLDEFAYRTYSVYNVMRSEKNYDNVIRQLDAKDKAKRDESVQIFQKIAGKAGIHFSIHRDKNVALQDVRHESMFADLVVISKYETFTKYKEKLPTRFVRELLAGIQCPVLLSPASFKPITKIVFLYDGSPSALHAIKMFSYLFKELSQLPVEVLTIKNENVAGLRVPDNKLMREFIKRHFPQAQYTVLKGDPEVMIVEYLKNYGENQLVILGAYRRSEVSRFFKTSMADILMKELETPLFIAHNK